MGFTDPIGEYVKLSDSVEAMGPVEHWLTEVELGMRQTLYDGMRMGWMTYPQDCDESIELPLPAPTDCPANNRGDWFFSIPAAMAIAVDEIYWTRNCRDAIKHVADGSNKDAIQHFLDFTILQIDNMVKQVQGTLTKQQRCEMTALITIDVHAKDVIKTLVAEKVNSVSAFEWISQLRYYWNEKGGPKGKKSGGKGKPQQNGWSDNGRRPRHKRPRER